MATDVDDDDDAAVAAAAATASDDSADAAAASDVVPLFAAGRQRCWLPQKSLGMQRLAAPDFCHDCSSGKPCPCFPHGVTDA